MKQLNFLKTILSAVIVAIFVPAVVMADPAGPGDGGDPFAAPVNGGLVFVVVIAFLYGVYRIYKITKGTQGAKINR